MITDNEYEYVIVGSGVAGSSLAMRLLERDRATSILILEAGPKVEARNRRFWWDYVVKSYGEEHKPYDFTCDQPGESTATGNTRFIVEGSRVMMYGGSTVHWGGWVLRYKREDFKLFSNTGKGADWPITYDELDSYYYDAEEHLTACGDDNESWNKDLRKPDTPYPRPPFWWTAPDGEMIEAFKKHNIEPGKMPMARYRKCMTTGTCKYCPIGARFSGQTVLDELLEDRRNINLKVITNAPATRVLVDSKERITGVEYLDAGTGQSKKVFGGTVIVCSGAYESPKLLMLSANEYWKNGIGNDYDRVGRYLVSHSMLKVRGRLDHNRERWFAEYDFPTLMSRTYDAEAYQGRNKIFLFKNRGLPDFDIADAMVAGHSREEIDAMLTGSRQQELQAFMEEMGDERNRVELAPGKNRFGLPKMRVHFSRTAEARQNAENWLDLMKGVVTDMGDSHSKYQIVKSEIQDPGGHHATGTCRMAETAEKGVTDKDLLVFGTRNLYVCSNAVMPTGAAVNPTLTLTALAFRLGDHLFELRS